jgi:uncharacterized protein
MIEVVIDSIRISLISQHRIVMLRDVDSDRQLPIWIGPCEAESITLELQDTQMARPLTHDLLKNVIELMGGKISHILISDLREQVFYAQLHIDVNGKQMDIDCRPSDAIALAVRAKVPVFIDEEVMEEIAITPEPDISEATFDDFDDEELPPSRSSRGGRGQGQGKEPEADISSLGAFEDFLGTLNLDDLGDNGDDER